MDNKENSPSVIARNDDACTPSSFFTVETTPSSLKMNPSSLPTSSLQRKQQQQQEETQTEEGGGVANNKYDGRTKSNYGFHDVTNSNIVLYEDFSLSEEDSSNNKVASSLTLQQEHHHYSIGNKGKIQQPPITSLNHHQTDPPGLNSSIRFLSTNATTTAATTSSSSLLVDDHPASSILSSFIDTDPPGKKTKMNTANPSVSLEISDDDEEEELLLLLEQRKEETSNKNHHTTTTQKLLALLSNDPSSSSTVSSSSSSSSASSTMDDENNDDEIEHNNNLVLDTSTFSSILEISTLLSEEEEGEETIEFDYANDDGSCSDSGSSCIADYRDSDHGDTSSTLLQQSSTMILSPCQKKKLFNKLDQVRRSLAKKDMDDEGLYWMILTTPTMKLIVDFVPTTKLGLIGCFHILEEKYHDILNKYGNQLLNEIQRFLHQENLTDIIVRHNNMKKSRPNTLYLLSLYQQKKFIDTLKNLTSLWAKEEQDRGNQIIDWDILSPSTIKSIADHLPTTEEELDAVLFTNNLQHCGGENNTMHNLLADHGYKMKLIHKINEFLKYEKMKEQDIVAKQSIQRRNHRTTRQATASAVTTTSSKDVVTSNSSSMPRSLSRSHSQPLLLQPKKNKVLSLFGGSSSLLRRIFTTTTTTNNTTRQHTAAAGSTRFRRQKMMMNFQRGNLSFRTV